MDTIILSSKDDEDLDVSKEHRSYLHVEGDVILRDEETIVILEIISVNIYGREDEWRFSDGELEFSAPLQDEKFLESVRNGEISFSAETSIEARIGTIQSRQNTCLKTELTIIEVVNFITASHKDVSLND